jgi:hypothetical protein
MLIDHASKKRISCLYHSEQTRGVQDVPDARRGLIRSRVCGDDHFLTTSFLHCTLHRFELHLPFLRPSLTPYLTDLYISTWTIFNLPQTVSTTVFRVWWNWPAIHRLPFATPLLKLDKAGDHSNLFQPAAPSNQQIETYMVYPSSSRAPLRTGVCAIDSSRQDQTRPS